MRDADLRRAYHKLCRKHGLDDTEKAFKIFKAGVDYARGEDSTPDMLTRLTDGLRQQIGMQEG